MPMMSISAVNWSFETLGKVQDVKQYIFIYVQLITIIRMEPHNIHKESPQDIVKVYLVDL